MPSLQPLSPHLDLSFSLTKHSHYLFLFHGAEALISATVYMPQSKLRVYYEEGYQEIMSPGLLWVVIMESSLALSKVPDW